MSYGENSVDKSLFYGDLLVDFFDQENNMINPPSDVVSFYTISLAKPLMMHRKQSTIYY
ncbi:MAG: hypothetical protein NKF70_11050 [Methanobacterium sp. ERen5]|nr:MAG: hypothetical protein NKF70_11050 [Methanobacterium sp. ERen5]